jgi:hypothetical protein
MDINLLEQATFTAKVECQLPGTGVDVWRAFSFNATFKVLDETEQDALDARDLTKRDYLREVVVSVDGIPSAKDPQSGEEISAKEVMIRNQFTHDAAFAVYQVKTYKNGTDIIAKTSYDAKNYKRSRKH